MEDNFMVKIVFAIIDETFMQDLQAVEIYYRVKAAEMVKVGTIVNLNVLVHVSLSAIDYGVIGEDHLVDDKVSVLWFIIYNVVVMVHVNHVYTAFKIDDLQLNHEIMEREGAGLLIT